VQPSVTPSDRAWPAFDRRVTSNASREESNATNVDVTPSWRSSEEHAKPQLAPEAASEVDDERFFETALHEFVEGEPDELFGLGAADEDATIELEVQ